MGSKRKKEEKRSNQFFTRINSNLENKDDTLKASKPNKEFASSFMNKFFKKSDMISLMIALMKTSKKK